MNLILVMMEEGQVPLVSETHENTKSRSLQCRNCFAGGFVGAAAFVVVFLVWVQIVPKAYERAQFLVNGRVENKQHCATFQDLDVQLASGNTVQFNAECETLREHGVGVETFRSPDGNLIQFTFILEDWSRTSIEGWTVYPSNAAKCTGSSGKPPVLLDYNQAFMVSCSRGGSATAPAMVSVLTSVGAVHGIFGRGESLMVGTQQLQRNTSLPGRITTSQNFELAFDITPSDTVEGRGSILRLGRNVDGCEDGPSDSLPSFTFQPDSAKLTVCISTPGQYHRQCNDLHEALPIGVTSRVTCRLIGDALAIEVNGATAAAGASSGGLAYFVGFNGRKVSGEDDVTVWVSDDCYHPANAAIGHITYTSLW